MRSFVLNQSCMCPAVKRGTNCIFIGEHLTFGVTKLFYEARRLIKAKKLASAWTRNGLVNCKFTDDVAEKFTVFIDPLV